MISYQSILTFVLSAQKNRLIETVLLSTHNLCFGREIRKIYEPRSDRRDLLAIIVKSEVFTEKERKT